MVPRFIFTNELLRDRAREAILNFKNNLPCQYEEHRNTLEAREHLTDQALEYADMEDPENYQAYRTKENSDDIAIVHVSPSADRCRMRWAFACQPSSSGSARRDRLWP
jgi:hypothetical protein